MMREPEVPEGITSDKESSALVRAALSGDGGAFERLLAPIEGNLRALLRSLLRTRPEASVEEALQDTRLYLFQRLDRYDSQYPFVVFARGLARTIARRHLSGKSDLAPARSFEEGDDPSWDTLTPQELGALPENLQASLGAGRFEAPGAISPPSREFLELLEAYLRWGGYPHQQVAFGYSILVHGKAKRSRHSASGNPGKEKVPITGDPDVVVEEVGPRKLEPGSEAMLAEICEEQRLDPEFVRRVSHPLTWRLSLPTEMLFAQDVVSSRQFDALKGLRAGETRLLEYFGKDPRKSISDWTRTVKERIRKIILDPGAVRRIPLPQPPTPREPDR